MRASSASASESSAARISRRTRTETRRAGARRETRTRATTPEGAFAILACAATLGQLLEENTSIGGRVSAPILTMASTSALATAGALPATSAAYDVVWKWLMPIGVVLALLEQRHVFRGGEGHDVASVLGGFVVGAAGTVIGTLAAFAACGRVLGAEGWKIAGCLCASYIGGSVNFAATAQAVDMMSSGGQALLSAGMAADNFAMACYLSILFAINTTGPKATDVDEDDDVLVRDDKNEATKASICASLATSMIILQASSALATFAGQPSFALGTACFITPVFALTMGAISRSMKSTPSNLCRVLRFSGAESMSGALMLLFFATLGATADLRTVFNALAGGSMLMFIVILLATQLIFTLFVGHKVLKLPLWAVLIASNANVGGPATAAAMANAKGWKSAVTPAIVTGIFGYSIATFIGVAVGKILA